MPSTTIFIAVYKLIEDYLDPANQSPGCWRWV